MLYKFTNISGFANRPLNVELTLDESISFTGYPFTGFIKQNYDSDPITTFYPTGSHNGDNKIFTNIISGLSNIPGQAIFEINGALNGQPKQTYFLGFINLIKTL